MPSIGPPAALKNALAESVTTGSFIDTKFYVFLRRSSEGNIDKPRAVYANSFILTQQSEYFSSMLSSGFSEAGVKNMNGGFPEDEKPFVDNYDYEMDSDLDEDEEASVSKSQREPSPSKTAERAGRVIVIRDASHITFYAILVFLHTGEIEFRKLGDPKPGVSSKSVYRLADKYGLEQLKKLSLDHIRKEVSTWNIVDEVFSEYSSWYPQVREIEMEELVRALKSPSESATTREKLLTVLDQFGKGDYSYSTESILLLLDAVLNKQETESSSKPLEVTREHFCSFRSELCTAIVESLRSGVFVDVRIDTHSTHLGENFTVPLYSSRAGLGVYDAILQSLAHDQNADDWACDADSDLEEETQLESVEKELSNSWEGNNVAAAYRLRVGATKTWKSLLYYLYTGHCNFGPLRSQGRECRLKAVEGYTEIVPLCSPKSMIVLSQRVGLPLGFRRWVRRDLQSKITSQNVVEELFSKFSSRQPQFLNFETETLSDNRSSTMLIEQLKDKIRHTAGQPSHHSEALKSIFGMLIPAVDQSSVPPENPVTAVFIPGTEAQM